MKKIVLVFVSLFFLGLTTISCSKNDSEPSIEGKWIVFKTGISVNGVETLNDHAHTIGCQKDYTIFSPDGTAKDFYFSKDGVNCVEYIDSYTYSRKRDKITVLFDGITFTLTIANISDSGLKIIAPVDNGSLNVRVFKKE